MAKLRVPIDITEALLSHKAGSRSPIQRTYDVYTRLEPMRDALRKYEHYLFSTVLTEQSRNLLRQVPRSSVYAQILERRRTFCFIRPQPARRLAVSRDIPSLE